MKTCIRLLVFLLIIISLFSQKQTIRKQFINMPEEFGKTIPSDWLMAQRVYPYERLNPDAYEASRQQAITIQKESARMKSSGENWEFVGPLSVGGRITDVEMHSSDLQTIFACAASGGIYRSKNQGKIWESIFDDYETSAIGDMAIAETDKNILYVGTGEPNCGHGSITYDGYGVYKSTDGGDSFFHVGLENAGGIGRVEVDPQNADRVFVACMGNLFANNPERGIYRTKDGGITWENVLFISDSTGGIDLEIHPTNPDTIYASMWERIRHATHRSYGGETSGLFRSYDGGDNWEELTVGLPTEKIGRIGIGISKSNPNILYSYYVGEDSYWIGCFKSIDGGDSWVGPNSLVHGWYWGGKIQVDPTNPDRLWASSISLWRSLDGANTWTQIYDLHADQHGIYCHPLNPDLVITGNDGGVYISTDGTLENHKVLTLPITQFYTCEVNPHNPDDIMGGTQDNSNVRGSVNDFMDWTNHLPGGDGFVIRIDPSDENYMYVEGFWGRFFRSTDGGESFTSSPPTGNIRFNWKTPFVLDPKDPSILYLGSQKVHKSIDHAETWAEISGDLTNGNLNSDEDPYSWRFGTITSLAVSPLNSDIIYAGTDDGNVWINSNASGNYDWIKISEGLPKRWVTCVAADPYDENTAYVCYSGIRYFDHVPHVFKTMDKGASWINISGNLPDFPVNNIQIDPDLSDTYYVATDGGVFYTEDGGSNWDLLGGGIPAVAVLDLTLHGASRTLTAATYGRGLYRINLAGTSGISDSPDLVEDLNVYPNPAQGDINIKFDLDSDQNGKLLIFDMSGRQIRVLKEGLFQAGENTYMWDGTKSGNQRIAGTYICRLVTDKTTFAKQIQVVKYN